MRQEELKKLGCKIAMNKDTIFLIYRDVVLCTTINIDGKGEYSFTSYDIENIKLNIESVNNEKRILDIVYSILRIIKHPIKAIKRLIKYGKL